MTYVLRKVGWFARWNKCETERMLCQFEYCSSLVTPKSHGEKLRVAPEKLTYLFFYIKKIITQNSEHSYAAQAVSSLLMSNGTTDIGGYKVFNKCSSTKRLGRCLLKVNVAMNCSMLMFLFCVAFFRDYILGVSSVMDGPLLRAGRRYCALSNLSKFGAIRDMIDPADAVVYGMRGVDEIMKGIEKFHRLHCEVFWIFKSVEVIDGSPAVMIDFDRYWTVLENPSDSRKVYRSSASEIIEFNADCRIRCITYKSYPSEPVLYGHDYPCEKSLVLAQAEDFIADRTI